LSHRSLRLGPLRRCSFVVFFKTQHVPEWGSNNALFLWKYDLTCLLSKYNEITALPSVQIVPPINRSHISYYLKKAVFTVEMTNSSARYCIWITLRRICFSYSAERSGF
jgi:hypothetical protein